MIMPLKCGAIRLYFMIKSYAPQKDIKMLFEIHEESVPKFMIKRLVGETSRRHREFLSFWDACDFIRYVNRGASFRWSLGPLSVWGCIELKTILTTHPSLVVGIPFVGFLKKIKKRFQLTEWLTTILSWKNISGNRTQK